MAHCGKGNRHFSECLKNAVNIKNKQPVQEQILNCVQRITCNLVNGNFSFPFPLEPLLRCFKNPNGFMTNIPFAKCKTNLTAQCVFSTYGTYTFTAN